MLIQQAPFFSRDNFGQFLNDRGLVGEAAEIGTHHGDFAFQLLSTWQGKRLLCVDPYTAYDDTDPASLGDRELDFARANEQLTPFIQTERACIRRSTSQRIAAVATRERFDFVYLDACHQLDAITTDLTLWWPKVKPGGILAGHDILCPSEPVNENWGRFVQPAVFGFAEQHNLTVWLVPEPVSKFWSYYLEKPL